MGHLLARVPALVEQESPLSKKGSVVWGAADGENGLPVLRTYCGRPDNRIEYRRESTPNHAGTSELFCSWSWNDKFSAMQSYQPRESHAHRSLEEFVVGAHLGADVEYDVQSNVLLIGRDQPGLERENEGRKATCFRQIAISFHGSNCEGAVSLCIRGPVAATRTRCLVVLCRGPAEERT